MGWVNHLWEIAQRLWRRLRVRTQAERKRLLRQTLEELQHGNPAPVGFYPATLAARTRIPQERVVDLLDELVREGVLVREHGAYLLKDSLGLPP